MPGPSRTRTQLFIHLVGLTTGLSLVLGLGAWWWVDGIMREQAEERARGIAAVLADGGFAMNEQVRSRMEVLTGSRFRLDPPASEEPDGTVTVAVAGQRVQVDYRTEAYHRMRQQVLLALLVAVVAGTCMAALLAWRLARRHARPLEELAAILRRLGEGDWQTPVPADAATAELQALRADLEQLRCSLQTLSEQLRQGERLSTLGTFTATIAHEVRNPLSAVQLTVQLLQRRLGADEQLEMVRAELDRLDLTVDELLAFSSGMQVNPVPCAVEAVASDVCRLLERQARHAGVTLTVCGAAQLLVDPQRLRQLLLNLVLNAIQVQHGGGEVTIAVLDDGLRVTDCGPGVADEQRADLFQAFSSKRDGGTGLGLHLAASIAQAHGAALICEPNRPDGGASFRLQGLQAASTG